MLKATKLTGVNRINIILSYGYELRDYGRSSIIDKELVGYKLISLCVASPLRATRIMLSRILRIKLYSASVQWQFKPSHKLETNTLWSRGKTIYSVNQINKITRKQFAASTDSSH